MSAQSEQLLLSLRPPPAISFDSFIVEPANASVVHALRGWLQQSQAGVFFLAGGAGSGRSHLLQAACATTDALYLPLTELGNHDPEALFEGLERSPLICFDDIDAVIESPRWCEALFHLFNRHVGAVGAVVDGGGKWLVSAAMPAAQLACALPDLQSRLSWGGSYRLAPLDDAGRVRMLQSQAQQRGMQISDAVAVYILQRHAREPQALIALLDRIDRESLRNQRRITVAFVRTLLDKSI